MAFVRKIEITNFRALKALSWLPASGVNCLIGPGDTGKSAVLDAIDYCLGARRNLQITDADFYGLDVETPINIAITLGDLDDDLLNIDAYGQYLRGFNSETGEISPEPEAHLETVLTLQLAVEADLEPRWTLLSERAAAQGLSRGLNWADRQRLAPTRLGAYTDYNLSWRKGSILNRISEEKVDPSATLAALAREAREAFGDQAKDQLGKTLKAVSETAHELGIPVGDEVKALLDPHSVSFRSNPTLHATLTTSATPSRCSLTKRWPAGAAYRDLSCTESENAMISRPPGRLLRSAEHSAYASSSCLPHTFSSRRPYLVSTGALDR
jgi:putative ATP-dependent endonuclease of the OLD family